jgi:hypothetical protein
VKNVYSKGEVKKEIADKEDIFLISGLPRAPETKEDVSCLLSIIYDEDAKTRDVMVKDILPEFWQGKFLPHYSRVSKEVEEAYGFSHVAILEGPSELGVNFQANLYFSYGVQIKGAFLMVGYDETKKAFQHLHCVDCARGIAEWFVRSQPTWKAINANLSKGKPVEAQSPTKH